MPGFVARLSGGGRVNSVDQKPGRDAAQAVKGTKIHRPLPNNREQEEEEEECCRCGRCLSDAGALAPQQTNGLRRVRGYRLVQYGAKAGLRMVSCERQAENT